MKDTVRKYSALVLLILFGCYYSGISLFSHVHILNGASVVHSHLGGASDHDHSESQCAVIDLLSQFQSEAAVDFHTTGTPFYILSEILTKYQGPSHLTDTHDTLDLRGPPQS